MKKISIIIIIIISIISTTAFAQYKKPEYNPNLNKSTSNLILGIFNPKNFTMNHSFQVSMLSSAFGTISVTSYINSMNYKFSDKLNVSADVKLQYAPYVSSGLGNGFSKDLQNDLNGLSLSRLTLDYKISENSYLKLEYRKLDDLYYGYDPYYRYNPFYGYNRFEK